MAGDRAENASGAIVPLFGAGTALGQEDADLLDRFVGGDAVAFEAIVRRHGPMVLGVCRRILDDPNDGDDAFQATFALLVRRAGAIRRRASLASWLHGVARRTATGVRVAIRRRRERERVWATAAPDRTDPASTGDDWRAALDAELASLPERFRMPLILCDLEGRTHEAAALALGCPVGTVKSRLHRGRDRLRSRLTWHGLDPSVIPSAAPLVADRGGPIAEAAVRDAARRVATVAAPGRAFSFGSRWGCPWRFRAMLLGSSDRAGAVALFAAGLLASGVLAFHPVPAPPGRPAGQGNPRVPNPVDQDATTPTAQAPLVPEAAPVEKYRLANGLTVILRPVAGTEDAALVMTFDIGGDHDPAGRSGLGHLVEHLYLTAAAGPAPARSTEELMGRYPKGMNAQTGDRYTIVATVFPAAGLDAELTDAAARMGSLRVEALDLDRERPRLLAEVDNMFRIFPTLAAQNNARELVRPTPDGGRRGGTPEAVGRLTVDEVQRRLDRYYRPRNATLALAGRFDPTQVRATISARFGLIPPGEPVQPASEPGPAALGVVREVVTPAGNPGDPPVVSVAYLAPRPDDPLYAPFLVLATRLWAASSELADRAEGGGFPVYFTPLDDGAVIALTSRAKPGESGESGDAATRRIEAFVARTVGPPLGFFEAGRAAGVVGLLFARSPPPDSALKANLYGVAFALARRQQLGIEPQRIEAALRGVTTESLRRAAERFLDPARHAVAVVRR